MRPLDVAGGQGLRQTYKLRIPVPRLLAEPEMLQFETYADSAKPLLARESRSVTIEVIPVMRLDKLHEPDTLTLSLRNASWFNFVT